MTSYQISDLVDIIREELGLTRGVSPRIENIYEHDDNSLHLIASDRAEKSLLLGPGGRVAAELAKRTDKKVTIYGADEILLRRHRLRLTMSRMEEVMPELTNSQSRILKCLQYLISQEQSYPESQIQIDSSLGQNLSVALAFSGGIDSTATAAILKEYGIIPDAIMISLGRHFQNPKDLKLAEDWCVQQGVKQITIDLDNGITDILDRTDSGRIHPCGECHNLIMESARKYALEKKYEVLVTGELLPSGRQAVIFQDGLLMIHLPAALSLNKHRTEKTAENSGKKLFRRKFGCNLVTKSHSKGWKNMGPSIFRVLRELEAGVLTTGQGLDYIKDIVPHSAGETEEEKD